MGVELRRNLTGASAMEPGEWSSDPGKHTPGRSITVAICCPGCSSVSTLTADHVIDRQGRMTPAFGCERCPLLDWLTLCGWGDRP